MKKIYIEPTLVIENISLDDVIASSTGDKLQGDNDIFVTDAFDGIFDSF